MPPSRVRSFPLALAVVVGLSLVALAFSFLAPGFSLDNGLIYGGF